MPLYSCAVESVLREGCPVTRSPLALLHMKPRGSPSATVLTESKTLPWSSADLDFLHQANRRGSLPPERREERCFAVSNMILKRVAVDEINM